MINFSFCKILRFFLWPLLFFVMAITVSANESDYWELFYEYKTESLDNTVLSLSGEATVYADSVTPRYANYEFGSQYYHTFRELPNFAPAMYGTQSQIIYIPVSYDSNYKIINGNDLSGPYYQAAGAQTGTLRFLVMATDMNLVLEESGQPYRPSNLIWLPNFKSSLSAFKPEPTGNYDAVARVVSYTVEYTSVNGTMSYDIPEGTVRYVTFPSSSGVCSVYANVEYSVGYNAAGAVAPGSKPTLSTPFVRIDYTPSYGGTNNVVYWCNSIDSGSMAVYNRLGTLNDSIVNVYNRIYNLHGEMKKFLQPLFDRNHVVVYF